MIILRVLAFILVFQNFLNPLKAYACAGCRNPNMPVTRTDAMELRSNHLRISVNLAATAANVIHSAGCSDLENCDETPVQPLHNHEQWIVPTELRMNGEYGITKSWGLEAQIPYRVVYTDVSYSSANGRNYTPINVGIHHREEALAGFGDPLVFLRWSTESKGALLSVKAGSTLPVGQTEENPFRLGDLNQEHQHIQFGTGTFNPAFALDVFFPMGTHSITGFFQAEIALYENSKGFQPGHKLQGGLQYGRKIAQTLSGGVGAEVLGEGAEKWDGKIQQEGNLGRTDFLVSAFLNKLSGQHIFGFNMRVPVYRYIVVGDEDPGEIFSPLMVAFIFSRSFNLN